jgi:electron transfer flavoprotein beta subunit
MIAAFERSTTRRQYKDLLLGHPRGRGSLPREPALYARRAMHAVVLLKEILDWELPATAFRIDHETNRPPADLGPSLLGPFEQNALELALQLKDAGVVDRITALHAAPDDAVAGLRKALALRCDEAVQVVVESGDAADPSQTAELLVAALRRLGPAELVLAGRQAGDWDHGQVGYLVAERLGVPAVGLVFRAEPEGDRLRVWRVAPGGVEQFGVRLPAVLTVTSDASLQLRMGSVMDRMAANKKPITRWTPEDLGLSTEQIETARRLEIVRTWVPEVEQRCELIDGDDPAEAVATVLARLDALKLLSRSA